MTDFAKHRDYVGARTVGGFHYPPGLRHALPFYVRRPWVHFGHPIPLFEHLHATFGAIAHYRFMGTTIVFVNDPAYIHEILIQQSHAFVRERTLRRMKILLGEGLLTSDGATHMQQRKFASGAFHRERIAGYAGEIVANAASVRDAWTDGEEIDINDAMMRLSLRIIARTLFDTAVTPEVLSVADEVNTIMGMYNFLVAMPKLESYLHWPLPGLGRFRRSRGRLDAVVHGMIAQRRTLSREELEGRADLLSMLVAARDEGDGAGMTDTQLRDEALTIFLAGYETVANALTWTWYLLSQNLEAAAKMEAEVDAVLGGRAATLGDFAALTYTRQVFSESMRLYPPAWAMGRQCAEPVTLGPYTLPAGSHFFFSQYVVQRSAEYWPEPLAFRPERFAAENEDPGRARFTYFPFGGGKRQCIGENFAWMEGILALATVAQRWRFRFVPTFPVEVEAKITLRPKHPMMMRVEAR